MSVQASHQVQICEACGLKMASRTNAFLSSAWSVALDIARMAHFKNVPLQLICKYHGLPVIPRRFDARKVPVKVC